MRTYTGVTSRDTGLNCNTLASFVDKYKQAAEDLLGRVTHPTYCYSSCFSLTSGIIGFSLLRDAGAAGFASTAFLAWLGAVVHTHCTPRQALIIGGVESEDASTSFRSAGIARDQPVLTMVLLEDDHASMGALSQTIRDTGCGEGGGQGVLVLGWRNVPPTSAGLEPVVGLTFCGGPQMTLNPIGGVPFISPPYTCLTEPANGKIEFSLTVVGATGLSPSTGFCVVVEVNGKQGRTAELAPSPQSTLEWNTCFSLHVFSMQHLYVA
ncbi:hypothetical protein BV22DRAFT_1043407 [Leucogyrophana mollusca]|uniref:Uncharacterized protein n=1 Tax=Leucogyrophana mollusca TaxID=85980 RepID=A0ACB8BZC3_9AGAM|nr:hypothetical protein BV22DRAFT_1043407 [Leucogyrophana mollusca]